MKKNKIFSVLYSLLLIAFTVFVLLDFFVIERVFFVVEDGYVDQSFEVDSSVDYESAEEEKSAVQTQNSYEDENISIVLTEHRVGDTTVYVADVNVKSVSYLKTAFAKNSYGKNVLEKTSDIADGKNAILAINGDYYSKRDGAVLRNGKLYRGFSGDSSQETLLIHSNGSFEVITEDEGDEEALTADGVWQALSFGPSLVANGEVSVGVNDEVDKAMRNNPRTAIAWYGGTHYALVVGDGRTSESKGLSLYELGCFLKELGVKTAYNLDGGGSSTMYFNGEVVNNPTTNGKRISEREVSDIVYIGY